MRVEPLGRRIQIANAGSDQELGTAFAALVEQRAAALLVAADPFFDTRRERIVALAAQFKLPAIYQFRDYAVAGGLRAFPSRGGEDVRMSHGDYEEPSHAGLPRSWVNLENLWPEEHSQRRVFRVKFWAAQRGFEGKSAAAQRASGVNPAIRLQGLSPH
jgi:hypothetical protein